VSLLRFQTVERDSFFTRLDFRPKLVMMGVITIVVFVGESPLVSGALALLVVVACVLAGVRLGYLRTVIKVMIPFYVLLLLTHGFFNVDQVKTLTSRAALTPVFTFPEHWWLVGGESMSL